MTNRLATIWHNDSELTGSLAISIMKAKSEMKRPGWQRGADFDEASLRREIMELQSANADLNKKIEEQKEIVDSLTQQPDLAFEDCEITIEYSYSKSNLSAVTNINDAKTFKLTEIFKIIALEMMDVSIAENIIESTFEHILVENEHYYFRFKDYQLIKSILNQLKALGLIYSNWSERQRTLFWGLTYKGEKIRDDMTLIRNNHNNDLNS